MSQKHLRGNNRKNDMKKRSNSQSDISGPQNSKSFDPGNDNDQVDALLKEIIRCKEENNHLKEKIVSLQNENEILMSQKHSRGPQRNDNEQVDALFKEIIRCKEENNNLQEKILFLQIENEDKDKKIKALEEKLDSPNIINQFKSKLSNHFSRRDSDPKKNPPSGIRNVAQNCYMNAMTQALASSPKLIDQLYQLLNSATIWNTKLKDFLNILKNINDQNNRDDAANQLLRFMSTLQWNRVGQQDAFQLLSFVINAIEDEFHDVTIMMPPKLRILHSFSEDSKYNKIQDHLALSLPLSDFAKNRMNAELTFLLDAFFRESLIDDGPHKTTMCLYESAPDVMLFHIQANKWNKYLNKYEKPAYSIKYDLELKYPFKIQYNKGNRSLNVMATYKLVAVVEHSGSVSGGHYVTYRECNNIWYRTNDSYVQRIEFRCNVTPYIMVYEKVSERNQ